MTNAMNYGISFLSSFKFLPVSFKIEVAEKHINLSTFAKKEQMNRGQRFLQHFGK